MKPGDEVQVEVAPYSRGDYTIETQTVVKITPTGKVRLSGGGLFKQEQGEWVRWKKVVMGLELRETIIRKDTND